MARNHQWTDEEFRQLDEAGFVRLAGLIEPWELDAYRARVEELFQTEGGRAGAEFRLEEGARRLANVVDKGALFAACIATEPVLEGVAHVLGPEFKLSSLNVRSANPHNGIAQPLHADMGAVADERGYWVCNTVWLLDDFTPDNGALRVVPGSHKWGKLPQEVVADPAAPYPGEELVTGSAGDVFVMNAHVWHGGTANRTSNHRRAMHAFYCRRDKPQQQYQKRLLRPETQASLTERQRWVLALDDPLNDAVSANVTQVSGFLK